VSLSKLNLFQTVVVFETDWLKVSERAAVPEGVGVRSFGHSPEYVRPSKIGLFLVIGVVAAACLPRIGERAAYASSPSD
jgi:hypothetical protein